MSIANFLQLEAEEVKPELLIVPKPYIVYRTTGRGRRYYFREVHAGVRFYSSVTTINRAMMPTPDYLRKWQAEKGWEASWEVFQQAAKKGTLMHMILSRFLIDQNLHLDKIPEMIATYVQAEEITFDVSEWTEFMQKAVLSFANFCSEVNLVPIAIEMPLVSELGYAGCLDLVAEIDAPTGRGKKKSDTPDRMRVLIDWKSGSVDSDEYAVQIHAYKRLWEEAFPELPIARLYNWAPKDWRTQMSYTLKDQTESSWDFTDFERNLMGYQKHYPTTPPVLQRFTGSVSLGATPVANVVEVSPIQAALNRITSTPLPAQAPTFVNGPVSQYFNPDEMSVVRVLQKFFTGVN